MALAADANLAEQMRRSEPTLIKVKYMRFWAGIRRIQWTDQQVYWHDDWPP